MTIINTSPDRLIQLGYEGEDRVTVLRFRYGADWLENGEGIFNIRVRRHGEHTAYNAQLVTEDPEYNCLLMTVTNVELSVKGSGEMQVVYSGADFVKKGPIYSYNVSRAVDEAVDPPAEDVYTQIIESLSDLQMDVRQIDGDVADLSELTTAKIGDLSALTTMAKTDLVSAINEVNEHGGTDITVDDALSDVSENPVQNKAVTRSIRELSGYAHDLSGVIDELGEDVEGLETAVQRKADTQTVSALADAVNGLDSDVQGLQTVVQGKADTATVTALSGTVTGLQTSKADKSYVDTQLAEKASTQTVSDLSDDVSDLQTGLAEKVVDVQVNGTSVVTDGVANLPMASNGILGVVKVESGATYTGIGVNRGLLYVIKASDANIKSEDNDNRPIVPSNQHIAAFYGLAKVAGHDEKSSTLPVGTYSDEAKIAIQKMLGIYEAPWKLIGSGSFDNATSEDCIINTDSNGNAFELTDAILELFVPPHDADTIIADYGRVYFIRGNTTIAYEYLLPSQTKTYAANSTTGMGIAQVTQEHGLMRLEMVLWGYRTNRASKLLMLEESISESAPFLVKKDYFDSIKIGKITGQIQYRLYGKRKWT